MARDYFDDDMEEKDREDEMTREDDFIDTTGELGGETEVMDDDATVVTTDDEVQEVPSDVLED